MEVREERGAAGGKERRKEGDLHLRLILASSHAQHILRCHRSCNMWVSFVALIGGKREN